MSYWRLTYPLTRRFSFSFSLIGIITIFMGLLGVIIGTLLTKGKVLSPTVYYYDTPEVDGYLCNSTLVYPGQTFGAIESNTTFEYKALNNFAYKQESFTNCSIQTSLRTLTVIGPPISWPSIGLGLTVQCFTSAGLPAKFSTVDLLHWTRNSSDPSQYAYANSIWDQTMLALYQLSLNGTCGGRPVSGYVVHDSTQQISTLATGSEKQCPLSYTDFSSQHPDISIPAIISTAKAGIDFDFGTQGSLGKLPGLVYPCTQKKKVWAPFGTVLWDCYTTAAASLGPLILVIRTVLRFIEKRWQKRSSHRNGVPQVERRRQGTLTGDTVELPAFPNDSNPYGYTKKHPEDDDFDSDEDNKTLLRH